MPDADSAWARASVLQSLGGTAYEVRVDGIDDNDEAGQSDWGAGEVRRVDLAGDPLNIYRCTLSPVYWLLDVSILVAACDASVLVVGRPYTGCLVVLYPRERALWQHTTRQGYHLFIANNEISQCNAKLYASFFAVCFLMCVHTFLVGGGTFDTSFDAAAAATLCCMVQP